MRSTHIRIGCLTLLGLLFTSTVMAQRSKGLPFTYQGQLKQAGDPVTGPVEFRFSLWNAEFEGTQVGSDFLVNDWNKYLGVLLGFYIYSYGRSIKSGNTSIWSLRRTPAVLQRVWNEKKGEWERHLAVAGEPQRLLTIEVNNRTNQIVQQRGKLNRVPKNSERKYVNDWAQQESLSFGRWCV